MEDPTKAVILVAKRELLAVEIQPRKLLTMTKQSGEGTEKIY